MPQGSYTEMLGRLAANEALLRIYRSSSPHLRMRDRELILRFFALVRASPSGLRSPVKARPSPTPPLTHVLLCPPPPAPQAWLNEEIREFRDLPPKEVSRMTAVFERAIGLAWEIFGESAFRPVKLREEWTDTEGGRFEQGEVNVALWDTVMYSMAQHGPEQLLPHKEALLEAFVNFAADPKLRKLLVSQPKAVMARAEAWDAVLRATIAGEKR